MIILQNCRLRCERLLKVFVEVLKSTIHFKQIIPICAYTINLKYYIFFFSKTSLSESVNLDEQIGLQSIL